MKFQSSSIILCLCAAVSVSSTDNDFMKYLSAKKSSVDYLPGSLVGVYKNWLISFWESDIHFIDVDTGALVKTIIGSFTLTDDNSLLSGAEVVDKYLMIYYSDSVIQQWDLDTGEIVREIKPSRRSTLSRECVWHFDLDLVFCSLSTGFVRKINMATKRIETEFYAHDNYCHVQVNSSFVYTASVDGSFTLTDGNGLISGAEVVDKYLMIYYSDSVIQQWDLDTGEIVREIKPSRSGNPSRHCVWHFDLDIVFCSLSTGFVRKINMATKRIETEFDAHDNYCFLLVNGSFLYTAGYDGLVKKFDLFGTLLNTLELSLGYAYIVAVEGEYLFISYYNIDVDRKVRLVRWNHITGIPEEFPLFMGTILDPVSASKDYYYVNSSFVYTASVDGLVKKFDLFGNLLNTYELSLGYPHLAAFEDDYIFVHGIISQESRRSFPLFMGTILDPVSASKDYYYGILSGLTDFEYAQFFKTNLSLVRTTSTQQTGYWTLKIPNNGERFFFPSNNSMFELFVSKDGLNISEGLNLEYSNPSMLESFILNDTKMIAVYSRKYPVLYTSKFIELTTGIYSGTVDIFIDHKQFQFSGELLVAAVGKGVVAYHVANMSLAWKSPQLSPQNIEFFQVKDGFIYFTSFNYAGWYNATTFEKIGLIVIKDRFFGIPAFLNGIIYTYYTANSVYALDLLDGRVLRRYAGMSNMINYVLIHGDHLYIASADIFIYKFRYDDEALQLRFIGHSGGVNTILIRGQIMYSGSRDLTLRKWNIDTGESLFIYYGHSEGVDRLHLSDYKLFSVTTREVRIWDLNRDRLLKILSDRSVNVISLRNSVNNLLTCTIDGTITSWNVERGYKVNELIKGEGASFVIGAQWQNNSLFIAKNDGTIVCFKPDDDSVAVLVSASIVQMPTSFFMKNDIMFLFGAEEGLAIKNITSDVVRRIEIKNYVSNALLVTDQFIFSGNNDSSITKFDVNSLDLLRTIKAHTGSVTVLGQFEKQLISGSEDNSLRKWNIDNLNLISDLKRDSARLGHLGSISAIHVEGENLFSGSEDKTVKRWNLNTGRVLFTYVGHFKKVTAIGFNNGSLFTTAEDEIIQIFNVNIVPSRSTTSATSTTLTRIPPRIINNVEESSGLSTTFLIIIISAAVVLLIPFAVTCMWFKSKKSNEKSGNDA
ncbi:hypothetical protein MP638_004980, partial [Amoeboaphelidium occidentale]